MDNEINEKELTTFDLEQKIRHSDEFDEEAITSNPPTTFSEYLESLLENTDINRSKLIGALNVERSYGYQIINGTRVPTRENIIKIAIFAQLTVEQTQRLLKLAERCELYVRRPYDAKIIYCLEHKLPFKEAMDFILK